MVSYQARRPGEPEAYSRHGDDYHAGDYGDGDGGIAYGQYSPGSFGAEQYDSSFGASQNGGSFVASQYDCNLTAGHGHETQSNLGSATVYSYGDDQYLIPPGTAKLASEAWFDRSSKPPSIHPDMDGTTQCEAIEGMSTAALDPQFDNTMSDGPLSSEDPSSVGFLLAHMQGLDESLPFDATELVDDFELRQPVRTNNPAMTRQVPQFDPGFLHPHANGGPQRDWTRVGAHSPPWNPYQPGPSGQQQPLGPSGDGGQQRPLTRPGHPPAMTVRSAPGDLPASSPGSPSSPIPCDCGKWFANRRTYLKHRKTANPHRAPGAYKCKCGKHVPRKDNFLSRHFDRCPKRHEHRPADVFICVCSKYASSSVDDFQQHMKFDCTEQPKPGRPATPQPRHSTANLSLRLRSPVGILR